MINGFPLLWILLMIVIGIFLGGCVWRMSHVNRDRNPRRD